MVIDEAKEQNYAIKSAFKTTNYKEKYEAWFFGIMIAKSLGTKEVEVQADSQVVVSHVREEFTAKSEKLKSI